MNREPGQYSGALVCELYIAYQMELKILNPQWRLWRGTDPLEDIVVRGFLVNISTQTIYRVLNGPQFLPSANITRIHFYKYEMWKVMLKQIGMDDKLIHYSWMAGIILSNREEAPRVVGDIDILSSIVKDTLKFQAKVQCILVQHKLSPTLGENVMSLDKIAGSRAVWQAMRQMQPNRQLERLDIRIQVPT